MPRPPARLLLIADRFTDPAMPPRILRATEGGVSWIMLRDHQAPPRSWEAAAEALRRALPPHVFLSLNRRLDLALRWHTGFHTGHSGPTVREARQILGAEALIGYSAHDVTEILHTHREGGDYALFSPVFSTTSKPEALPVGLEALEQAAHAVPGFPVLALGGITPERVEICLKAGAYGVAVLSGILHAPDPARAARMYLEAIARGLP